MKTVRVELAERAYDIIIGEGLLGRTGELIRPLMKAGRDRVFVVADETVAKLHLETLGAGLTGAGISFDATLVPSGEKSKSFDQLDAVLERPHRGVVQSGTISSWRSAAAWWATLPDLQRGLLKRGARFVQIPTTLAGAG